jgi:hypothetical protein
MQRYYNYVILVDNINTWLANIVGDVDNVYVDIDNLNNPLA